MRKAVAGTAIAVLALVGCQSMDESQKETAKTTGIGAAAGAAVGAIAGGSDNRGRGAAIGAAVGALGGYAWSQRMENQRRQAEAATQGTGAQVEKTADNRIRVVVPDNISFDSGRADIKPGFRSMLDQFAQSLTQNPQTTVQIIGHTDSTGDDAFNQNLSRERALAARDYLATRGVSMNRIAVDGRGEREPVAANDSEAGRARNRRVEIFLQESAA
ncbi:MAG: OmpA/MotB domain protein [Burkholderiaceae bacterium]|jgi:outer membrane protein OmpA-like peptidoglycan-associated protein|nr:OmpA/MotB domain protein [Burkholderiaceae bacterium]